MPVEFEDIIITGKPDSKQVHLSNKGSSFYLFPFPISATPSDEWIEVFNNLWNGHKYSNPLTSAIIEFPEPDFGLVDSEPTPDMPAFYVAQQRQRRAAREMERKNWTSNSFLPKLEKKESKVEEVEVEVKESTIMLKVTLEWLSSASKHLLDTIDNTNRVYKGILQLREEERLAIQEAINKIELP